LGWPLYNPIWTNGVRTPRDFALAMGGFLLLTVWKAPPWVVVLLLVAAAKTIRSPDRRASCPRVHWGRAEAGRRDHLFDLDS
jgi:hypothetical protein